MPGTNAASGFELFTGTESLLDEQAFDSLDFEDVVMRVFPLKANMNRLRSFCDRYLNFPKEKIAHFAPAAPYVFLQVLNYGRMSSPSSNLGWVAQNEVVFNVPLVGRWPVEGKYTKDFAFVAPFIFVDDEWSIATGREVYGWPKVLARLTPGISPWMKDPRSRRRLMTLETLTMSRLYAGETAEYKVLVEIEQDAPQLFGQIPPKTDYLLSPFARLPKLFFDNLASAPDFLEGMTNLFKTSGDPVLANLLGSAFKGLLRLPPKLFGNTLNLKQFRASRPGAACYQSLVNARMQIKRFNAGGLLGSVDLMRGDPSAGYAVLVHRLPSFPIIESLGLEVESEHSKGGTPVALLRPLMPCWASLDLRYERGSRIAWCSEDSTWVPWIPSQQAGEASRPVLMPALTMSTPAESAAAAREPVPDHDKTRTSTPFNTTLGQAAVPVSGPFDFFGASLRVLPIRAKSKSLAAALPKDLGRSLAETYKATHPSVFGGMDPGDLHLEPVPGDPDSDEYDSWVYLVVTTYHSMASATNDIGWWAKRELAFAFVVKMEFQLSEADKRPLYWLYWPYQFSDSPIAVTEGREVLGLPTAFARLEHGRDPWMGSGGTSANRVLLQLTTKDFPALGVGQGDIERLVLDVERTADGAVVGSGPAGLVARFKAQYFPSQTESGAAGALTTSASASEYLRGVHFSNLSLKQFRDEENPNRSCYQALVAFERGIGSLWEKHGEGLEFEPLGGKYSVRFHRSSLWDISTALGLKARLTRSSDDVIAAVCEVENGFEVKTDIRSHLPTTLMSRSVASHWRPGRRGKTYLVWRLLKAGILEREDIQDRETLDELDRLEAGEEAFLVPFTRLGTDRAFELALLLESCLREPELEVKSGVELVELAKAYLAGEAAAILREIGPSTGRNRRRISLIRAWAEATAASGDDEELARLAARVGRLVERAPSKELLELAAELVSDSGARAAIGNRLLILDQDRELSMTEIRDLVREAIRAGEEAGGDVGQLRALKTKATALATRSPAKEWMSTVRASSTSEEFKKYLEPILARTLIQFPELADGVQSERLDDMLTIERLVADVSELLREAG